MHHRPPALTRSPQSTSKPEKFCLSETASPPVSSVFPAHPSSPEPATPPPNSVNTFVPSDILTVLSDHFLGPRSALRNDLLYLGVYHSLHPLAVGLRVLGVGKGDVAQRRVHAKFCHEVVCQVVGLLEIVVGSGGYFVEEKKLGAATTQNETYSV